jgi:FAST kinase domain-containing protein 2
VNCAILGIYPHSLISQIFEESVLSLYFAKDPSFYDYLQLNTLNRCVRTECPEYEGSYPSLSLIKQAHQRIYERGKKKEDVHFSLKKALQTGFGGVSYVASGLLTKSGHFVGKKFCHDFKYLPIWPWIFLLEYVVTMRPGGYPVAINCSTPDSNVLRYLEDLNGTSGCQM